MIALEKRKSRESFRHHHYADVRECRESWEPRSTENPFVDFAPKTISPIDRMVAEVGRFVDLIIIFVAVFVIVGLWWSVTSVL